MSANEITPQSAPLDVVPCDTTEAPPGANEIHVVERDWGYELSFVHRPPGGSEPPGGYPIERLTITGPLDAAAVKQLVEARKAQLDTPTDRRAELEGELAFHEEEIARIKQELVEMTDAA